MGKKKKKNKGKRVPREQEQGACAKDFAQDGSLLRTENPVSEQEPGACSQDLVQDKSLSTDNPVSEEDQGACALDPAEDRSLFSTDNPVSEEEQGACAQDSPQDRSLSRTDDPFIEEQAQGACAHDPAREKALSNIGYELKKTALAKCNCIFIEKLQPDAVLDVFKKENIFHTATATTVRDIQEEKKTSEKNRQITEKIRKDPSKYIVFKTALVRTNQLELKTILEKEEVNAHNKLRGEQQCVCADEDNCPIMRSLACPENIESDAFASISSLKPELFKQFSEAVGDFKDGHYILMVSSINPIPHLAILGKVPWLAVIDFDPDSRSKGLLAFVEKDIEKQQSVATSTWKESCSFSIKSTSWIFMSGCNEHPDTITSKTFKEWKGTVSSKLISIISALEERVIGYTELTIVAIWPDERDPQRCMKLILEKLENSRIDPSIVVLCNESHEKSQLPSEDNHDDLCVIPFTLNDIINSVHSILGNSDISNDDMEFSLPTSDKTNNPKICGKDANVLKEDLAVLYIDNATGRDLCIEEIENERDRFYKGGTLSWQFLYTFKTGGGQIDIERDIHKEITRYIREKHIDTFKSGSVTLYHFPGSGGTTLAQRVLWDLKDTVPCAQVLHRTDQDALVEKVKILYDKTQLPVVLLLDGEDEQKIDTIDKYLNSYNCIIFFRVRRCTFRPRLKKGEFFLKQKVSSREANVLCSLYLDQCRRLDKGDECKEQIKDIAEEAKRDIPHSIFDFGLALYDYQYKGIRSYVKGCILTGDDDPEKLLPWQQALLMLSIAHYYGQISIPCHFFGRILKPKGNKVLNFFNIPREMKEFVVPATNEKQENAMRISHYVIAKEIIDQLLTSNRNELYWERTVSQTLSKNATENIKPHAVDLIREAGNRCQGSSSDTIIKLLIKIFISRDNITVGEENGELSHSTRARFSRIMEDVSERYPFSERFCILRQLTESFPEEAEFHAHLGRLYFICRPEMQDEAEECFQNALQVCEDDSHHQKDITLRNIYHMYGYMFSVRVYKYTGKTLDDKPSEQCGDSDILLELLENARNACDKFDKSRKATPPGYEQSYGYLDEIKVRQMFCDFAYRAKDYTSIYDLAHNDQTDIGHFVRDCYIKLDELYADCMYYIDPNDTEENIIRSLQATHIELFNTEGCSKRELGEDDIDSWKMSIILLKMKHGLRPSLGILESVQNMDDIAEITICYERILDEYLKSEERVNSRQVDIYFREWLFIIRHKKIQSPYHLDDVLNYVEEWYNKYKTQTGRFYLFILKTLYGFGSMSRPGNTEMLVESQELMGDLIKFSKYVQKPKYPREWLGQADEFRRVISGYRFSGKVQSQSRNVLESNQLEILTGTIYANNKPLAGYISLDIRRSHGKHVKVFFVPAKSNLYGTSYHDRRVEFKLGFSMSHGYEAFNVKELQTEKCKNHKCGKRIEFRSCDEEVPCSGCNLIAPRRHSRVTRH